MPAWACAFTHMHIGTHILICTHLLGEHVNVGSPEAGRPFCPFTQQVQDQDLQCAAASAWVISRPLQRHHVKNSDPCHTQTGGKHVSFVALCWRTKFTPSAGVPSGISLVSMLTNRCLDRQVQSWTRAWPLHELSMQGYAHMFKMLEDVGARTYNLESCG